MLMPDSLNQTEMGLLPKCTIIMERMGRYSHYLVGYEGKYYDPNLGVIKEFDMAKMVGYLEIVV